MKKSLPQNGTLINPTGKLNWFRQNLIYKNTKTWNKCGHQWKEGSIIITWASFAALEPELFSTIERNTLLDNASVLVYQLALRGSWVTYYGSDCKHGSKSIQNGFRRRKWRNAVEWSQKSHPDQTSYKFFQAEAVLERETAQKFFLNVDQLWLRHIKSTHLKSWLQGGLGH